MGILKYLFYVLMGLGLAGVGYLVYSYSGIKDRVDARRLKKAQDKYNASIGVDVAERGCYDPYYGYCSHTMQAFGVCSCD